MRFFITVFAGLLIWAGTLSASKIEVTDQFDFQLAIDFANNNKIDTLLLTTSGGVYTTTDTVYFAIKSPMTIIAADDLAERPILTHSAADSGVLEIFRVMDDLTIKGVVFDGGHAMSHGMKYAIRIGEGEDGYLPKEGLNVIVDDCVFKDIFRDKDLSEDGHGIYFLKGVDAGTVKVTNSTFMNIGYEAIRMTETEKYTIDRCLDTLVVQNCTFVNIDNESIRFYADTDTNTTDAYVLLENITVNNSAVRTVYIKNNQNTILRNFIVANARLDGRGDRSDYVIEIQQTGSFASHIDTFNLVFDPITRREEAIRTTKGADIDTTTIYGFDPMFADPENMNFTLVDGSPAYGKGYEGVALGDLRWATNPPSSIGDEKPVIVKQFTLDQNYPNPFNPETTIKYNLPTTGKVTLTVFDISGKKVATLVDGNQVAGPHSVKWHPQQQLASGIYFYMLRAGGHTDIRKMTLIK